MNAIEELENDYREAAFGLLRAQMMPLDSDYLISLKDTFRRQQLKKIKEEAEAALIIGWSRV